MECVQQKSLLVMCWKCSTVLWVVLSILVWLSFCLLALWLQEKQRKWCKTSQHKLCLPTKQSLLTPSPVVFTLWDGSVKAVLKEVTQTKGPTYWLGHLGGKDLDGVSIPFHTEFYFLRRHSAALFEVLEVYDVEAGRRVTGRVGSWDSSLGQLSLDSRDIWDRRSDLDGRTFRTVMKPFGRYLQVDDNKPETWHGMVPDIFNALAMRMNFTYTVDFSADRKWGGKDKVTQSYGVLNISTIRPRGCGTVWSRTCWRRGQTWLPRCWTWAMTGAWWWTTAFPSPGSPTYLL